MKKLFVLWEKTIYSVKLKRILPTSKPASSAITVRDFTSVALRYALIANGNRKIVNCCKTEVTEPTEVPIYANFIDPNVITNCKENFPFTVKNFLIFREKFLCEKLSVKIRRKNSSLDFAIGYMFATFLYSCCILRMK
jgi:hypothetical protein